MKPIQGDKEQILYCASKLTFHSNKTKTTRERLCDSAQNSFSENEIEIFLYENRVILLIRSKKAAGFGRTGSVRAKRLPLRRQSKSNVFNYRSKAKGNITVQKQYLNKIINLVRIDLYTMAVISCSQSRDG